MCISLSFYPFIIFFEQGERDNVNFEEKLEHVSLPSGSPCFPSIDRIPSFGKDLFDSGLRLDVSKGIYSPNNDKVESARKGNAPLLVPHTHCPLRAPQGREYIFSANAIIKEVDKSAALVFSPTILDKVSCTPFDGLCSPKCDFIWTIFMLLLFKEVSISFL